MSLPLGLAPLLGLTLRTALAQEVPPAGPGLGEPGTVPGGLGGGFVGEEVLAAELDPVLRGLYLEGVRLEREGAAARAAAAYRLVVVGDPSYAPAGVALGRARLAAGDRAGAEQAWRALPSDAEAVESLARMLLDERPAESMELYNQLRTLRLGELYPYLLEAEAAIRAQALDQAGECLDRYLQLAGSRAQPGGAGEQMVGLATALRDAGRRDEARAWLERYLAFWPGGERAEEVQARLDRIGVEEDAERLFVGGAEVLTAPQREELDEARRLAAGGAPEEALARVEGLLSVAPRSPDAWATRGDLLLRLEDVPAAEQAFLTAVALAPDEAAWRARLGLLLADRYAGRRHREAAEELALALTLRPGWTELHFRLGLVLQQSGESAEAVRSLRAYLAAEPAGPHAAAARQLLEDLTRARPAPPPVEQLLARPPEGVPTPAWEAFKRAQVYLRSRQDDARALAEVERALALAPDYVDALNLRALLELRAGRTGAAEHTMRQSLALRGDQPQTLLALGTTLCGDGRLEEGRELLRQAAERGAEEAWYHLAAQAEAGGDWLGARALLARYFARASGGRVHEEALALREALDRRWRLSVAAGAGLAALGLGLPLWIWARRRGGASVRELLERRPEAYGEIAAILSRMRHEVIKHNTTVLDTVAAALESGDPGPAREALARLGRGDGEPGALDRWEAYLAELEALSARLGVRLNARHRDPVLAPMCSAVRRLRRLGPRLGPRDAAKLRAAARDLNQVGYRELGRLLREVCVLPVDLGFLRGCWDQVRGEPAFRGQALPELELRCPEELPLHARIFRREMEDIVINLLRNGLQAVLDERPPGERALGLHLEVEADRVTGLERLCLRVLDNARSQLSDEIIHSRWVARGLGLTVGLVTRRQGQIRVEPAPGWTKAIAVRLPLAEQGTEAG